MIYFYVLLGARWHTKISGKIKSVKKIANKLNKLSW